MSRRPLAILVTLVLSYAGCACAEAAQTSSIIKMRCLSCHNADDRAGNVDLTLLASPSDAKKSGKVAELWSRVEKMVRTKRMPPAGEEPLAEAQRRSIVESYRQKYILRDGRPHIGVSPVRRLTRYELENTLEDLFTVRLKRPYVVSPESAGLLPSIIEQLYPADVRGRSGFDNDSEQLKKGQVPLLKLIACVDYALRTFDQNENARRRVLGFADRSKKMTADQARRILDRFADRASRGQATRTDRERAFKVWQQEAQRDDSYRALLAAMKTIVLSPSFVYRLEHSQDSAEPYPVAARELAVRLSYFLWSSLPDEELWKVAHDGSLLQPDVLRRQLQRMLNSPKRLSLSENFAGQWLGFDELRRNKVYYHGEIWTRTAYDELLFGFDELIKSDRSVLEMVDSNWSYLGRSAARGARAKGHQFKERYADIFAARRSRAGLKVERFYDPPRLYRLGDDRLGGLLTAAGIMRLTSAPNRTNPIRRGVWLLERIIGEEMHPPENIPPLAESEKKLAAKQATTSPADILKLHTANESCRICHQHIDPLGLGLENFSSMGKWRTAYPNKARIISQGVLPNGQKFTTPQSMKRALLANYQDRIVDNMIRKMLSYAIGRPIYAYDRPTIERIRSRLLKSDYRMGVLIEQIVLSQPFRCKQDR